MRFYSKTLGISYNNIKQNIMIDKYKNKLIEVILRQN